MRQDGSPDSLTDIVERLGDKIEEDRYTTRLGVLVDAFGRKAYGPLLLIPAVLAVSPIGAIPGMSIVTATLIALIAGQMLIGRVSPWLPDRLMRFGLPNRRLAPALDWLHRKVRPLDRYVGRRWTVLVRPPAGQIVAVVMLTLAAAMIPLAAVPFGVTPVGAAIAVLALAITLADGVVMAVGLAISASALGAAIYLLV